MHIFLSRNGAPILRHSWRAVTMPHEASWQAIFLITHHHDRQSSYSHAIMMGSHLMSSSSRHAVMTDCHLQGDGPSSTRRAHHHQGDGPSSTRRARHDRPSSSRWWAIVFKVMGRHLQDVPVMTDCHFQGDTSWWVVFLKMGPSWWAVIFDMLTCRGLSTNRGPNAAHINI